MATPNVLGAIPARRLLTVARYLGDDAQLGSVCPRLLDDDAHPDFGFNPVADQYVNRHCERCYAHCYPAPRITDGETDAFLIEAGEGIDCSAPGRSPASGSLIDKAKSLVCDANLRTDVDCSTAAFCAIDIIVPESDSRGACYELPGDPVGACIHRDNRVCGAVDSTELRFFDTFKDPTPYPGRVYVYAFVPDRSEEAEPLPPMTNSWWFTTTSAGGAAP